MATKVARVYFTLQIDTDLKVTVLILEIKYLNRGLIALIVYISNSVLSAYSRSKSPDR